MTIMYARTEVLYAVLLVASFLVEGSQATHQARAPQATSTSAGVSPLATATISFRPLPTPTSCASAIFNWLYDGPKVPMSLQITNVNVPQLAPPPVTTPTITTPTISPSSAPNAVPPVPMTPANLTQTLITSYDPGALSYTWNNVNVSQGWYMLLVYISTRPMYQTTSSPFFVRTGSNISCLALNSHTPTSTSSLFSQSSPTSIPSSTSTSSKVPTIVGVTVGMAVLLMTLLILWFFLIRKRKSRTTDGGGSIKNSFRRWKGSRGFNANASRSSRSHLTSQLGSIGSTFGPDSEEGIIGVEKKNSLNNNHEQHGVALSTLPVLHNQSTRPRQGHTYSPSSSSLNLNEFGKSSSARYSTQPSIDIDSSAIFPPPLSVSGESPSSNVLRSHSLSTTGTQYSLSNSVDASTTSFPPSAIITNNNKEIRRHSVGKKRKPAPIYNPSKEEVVQPSSVNNPAAELQQYSTSTRINTEYHQQPPELSHKNSFGPGGIEGKPLHYLIPDMPLSQTS